MVFVKRSGTVSFVPYFADVGKKNPKSTPTFLSEHDRHLLRKLSFAASMRRVPPFHLDLFNTVKPTDTTNKI